MYVFALNGTTIEDTEANFTGLVGGAAGGAHFIAAQGLTEEEHDPDVLYLLFGDYWAADRFTIRDDQDYIVTYNDLPSGTDTAWGFNNITKI